MVGVAEFGDKLMQQFLKGIYDTLYSACEDGFNDMFGILNDQIVVASAELTTSPQAWSGTGFALIQNVAENIFLPIGACILTFVFCWEIVQMLQDSNRMHNIKPENILMQLLKLGVCLLACSKAFDLVMGFFRIGSWATAQLSAGTVGTFGEGLTLVDILPQAQDPITGYMIAQLAGYTLLIYLGTGAVWICTAAIQIRVILWFLELFIYSAAAPVPFATFGNKEWGQMGMNYTRKMLAVCFEGFFMLLTFALYGALVSGLGGADFAQSMVLIIGGGFGLVMLLFRSGSISASIFNAH